MGLLEEILAEIADATGEILSEQLKSEKARKDKFSKNSKEAEDFFKQLGQKTKNKRKQKIRKTPAKTNVKRKSPSESMTPIEATSKKNVEDVPIEERLRRYKQSKRSEENQHLQKDKNALLTFTNLEKVSSTKKYKQILKSRKGAKDAFIYSIIFERKV